MIAQFALRLICGMSLMWALMPRRQVTSGFFRIQMLVVMGLGVLAAMSLSMDAQSALRAADSSELANALPAPFAAALPSGLIATLGFVGSVLWTLERRSVGSGIGFGILLLATKELTIPLAAMGADRFLVFWGDSIVRSGTPTISAACPTLLAFGSELANAGVLGGAVVGMLLGHWYLTAPTMSIEPLKRINLFLGIASILRFAISAAIWLLFLGGAEDADGRLIGSSAAPSSWLGLRWLAGIVGPLVVSLMVWRILKYRNTQAATGVLFVGVILVFIGDMTATLLFSETKWPL
jgi:hypothetical protein